MDDKDRVIELQQTMIAKQEETIRLYDALHQSQQQIIDAQRQELAQRRYRDHLVDESPWGFALWLALHEIYPFKWWYGRFR